MDPEEQASLLPSEPQPDSSSVKVWPLIVHLKRDAMVREYSMTIQSQDTTDFLRVALTQRLVGSQ
jgi:hypothetical protein